MAIEATVERRALDYVRYDIYDRDLREIRDDIRDVKGELEKAAKAQKDAADIQRTNSRQLLGIGITSAATLIVMLFFFILERVV